MKKLLLKSDEQLMHEHWLFKKQLKELKAVFQHHSLDRMCRCTLGHFIHRLSERISLMGDELEFRAELAGCSAVIFHNILKYY